MKEIRIDDEVIALQPPLIADTVLQNAGDVFTFPIEDGECWWGGAVEDAGQMPYGERSDFHRDLASARTATASSSQSSPLLVSTRGRYVWSDAPFFVSISQGEITVRGDGIHLSKAGDSLRDAFLAASGEHFPATGIMPPAELFAGPQYNTWIENPYTPTQEGVLAYVRQNLDAGLPPGVIMIDDSWGLDYGVWEFDRARFPDAARMVDELSAWGCSVMLWIVPFVSPDSAAFRDLEARDFLVRTADGEIAVRRWWNGLSALLDVTNESAIEWLRERLDVLVEAFGVKGFKFDGGDLAFVRDDDLIVGDRGSVGFSEAWAQFGASYAFNEFRATWKSGGLPLAQRLQDKPPSWGEDGILALIPELIAQGMIGHPFACPDMVGGGEIVAMQTADGVDQEFFVRYAQIAAVSPMMQFSVSPARVLDAVHQEALLDALELRRRYLPRILELADVAAKTGEPILRPMSFHSEGLDQVRDQFFLGDDLFFAPVVEPGATSRRVAVPPGAWFDDEGVETVGPAVISVPVTLTRIPHFTRQTA